MLERINTNLDELSGIKRKPDTELIQAEVQITPPVLQKPRGEEISRTVASPNAKITK